MDVEKEIVKRLKQKYPDIFIGTNLIKLCLNCTDQQKINQNKLYKNGWEITHGRCTKHFVEMLKEAEKSDAEIAQIILLRRKSIFDLGASETKDLDQSDSILLDWLHNPTKYKK